MCLNYIVILTMNNQQRSSILTNSRGVEISWFAETNQRVAAVVAPAAAQINQAARAALLPLAGFTTTRVATAVVDGKRFASSNATHHIAPTGQRDAQVSSKRRQTGRTSTS